MTDKNKELLFVKGAFTNLPGWDEVIKLMNHSYNHSEMVFNDEDFIDPRFVINENNKEHPNTGIFAYDRFTYHNYLPWLGWSNEYSKAIPSLNGLINQAEEKYNIKLNTCKVSLNFVNQSDTYGIHDDHYDIVSLHCVGKTKYRIYKSFDTDEYDEYEFEPGDFMYMPKGTIHQVVVDEPRVTLIFAAEFIND